MSADDPIIDDELVEPGQAGEETLDESEDLFGFDQYVASKEEAAQEIDLEELLEALGEVDEDEPEEDAPAAAATSAPSAEPNAPATAAPTSAAAQAQAPAAQPLVVAAAPSQFSLKNPTTLLLIGVACMMVLGNVGVVAFLWKASERLGQPVQQQPIVQQQVPQPLVQEPYVPPQPGDTDARGPAAAPTPEQTRHSTFAAVEADLERGDWGTARQRLYALLAIADRLDSQTRAEVEPRANFLLADTLRLEALALPSAEDDQ